MTRGLESFTTLRNVFTHVSPFEAKYDSGVIALQMSYINCLLVFIELLDA